MYENSRFLKNRFTFCGVNTNFGQQWAPPAYYHFTPIVSKGKHCYLYVISVAYRYRKSISIIELFVSMMSIYIEFLATNF